MVLEGLIFFDNAFIAVWDAAIVVAVVFSLWTHRKIDGRAIVTKGIIGSALPQSYLLRSFGISWKIRTSENISVLII